MTRMLPVTPSVEATGSERRMFEIIRDAPGTGHFYALHSLGMARHPHKSYAECDFVLICPAGVFCLEVKGGQISRHDGVWTIGWPGSSYTSEIGPFKQAQSHKWGLIDELKRRLPEEFVRNLMIGWGIMTPDVEFRISDPECDPDLIYDSRDLNHPFAHYVERLAAATRKNEEKTGRKSAPFLSPEYIKKIVDALRQDFDLIPTLQTVLSESRREIAALSQEQYRVLDAALDEHNPRILCQGAAGTGKTLIALEAASRLNKLGHNVLYLCFNRVLAASLRRQPIAAGIRIDSLHRYMYGIITKAGLQKELQAGKQDERSLYREIYPKVFEQAVLELSEREGFEKPDALILDEGQDILFTPVIDTLDCILKDGFRDGRWLIMYDAGLQADLYGGFEPKVLEWLRGFRPLNYRLTPNYRNPPPVVQEMCNLTGAELPECRRKINSPVDYVSYTASQDQLKKLRALLVDLFKQGIRPAEITILTGRKPENSVFAQFQNDIGKRIAYLEGNDTDGADKEAIHICTVSAFKGLENEVVILLDLPEILRREEWEKAVWYVGMTRARTKLYAFVPPEFVKQHLAGAQARRALCQ